ncbi:hypothetical protein C8Q75DRAFT_572795 [Abortiporus biennis]|nr:hypothetical protein C8Q75DRAFT_572795 [Abortiporus biennis]
MMFPCPSSSCVEPYPPTLNMREWRGLDDTSKLQQIKRPPPQLTFPSTSRPQSTQKMSSLTLIRCPDVWYEDGGVVLQAESTLFRVYPGILAEHSVIFKDMFSLPKPSKRDTLGFECCGSDNTVDMYEGECPLVRIPGEKAAVLRILLLALFDTRHSILNTLNRKDINTLTSVLRLSDKFAVSFVRDQICQILSASFTIHLDDFQKIIRDFPVNLPFKIEDKGRLFDLANIIRDMDEHLFLLPPVLYTICLLFAPQEILDGYEVFEVDQDGEKASKIVQLNAVNLRSVMNALLPLDRIAHNTSYHENRGSPHVHSKCSLHYRNTIKPLETMFRILPLYIWPNNTTPQSRKTFCAACREFFLTKENERIRKVWDRLPGFFGLPSWRALGAIPLAAEARDAARSLPSARNIVTKAAVAIFIAKVVVKPLVLAVVSSLQPKPEPSFFEKLFGAN